MFAYLFRVFLFLFVATEIGYVCTSLITLLQQDEVRLEVHDSPKSFYLVFYREPNLSEDKWHVTSDTIGNLLDISAEL